MDIDITDISENLNLTIENRFFLELKTHTWNSIVEKNLKSVIYAILQKIDKPNYEPLLYSIAKELVINACKANQKRVFFKEKKLNITFPEDYRNGMNFYQKTLSEKHHSHYASLCKKEGLHCTIAIQFSPDGMRLEISNNSKITKEEESAIREKLEKGMKYKDIAEYFFHHKDDTEGAGLGLAMILIMLKNQGIDPRFFRIVPHDDKTVARVECPFNSNFQSIRK